MIKLSSITTLVQIQDEIHSGRLSTVELVRGYLAQIDKTKNLNVYIEVYRNEAVKKAIEIDEKLLKGQNPGSLFGLVISIKDVICFNGHQLSAASKILQNFEAQFTATALQRLLDEDVIVIGRTNCDEFAMGSTNENSCYGPTRNGDDYTKSPGGSSGAAAVSVQVHTCHVALGSDTGGSVRQPASFCGVKGFKPSYGRISRYGLIAYGSSFDQIGIIGREINDIAKVLEVMAGKDPKDTTSSNIPISKFVPNKNLENQKIAIFKGILDHPSLNPSIAHYHHKLISELKKNGHRLDEVDFDYLDFLVPCYYILTTAEASSNLGRYDGIRYGSRSNSHQSIEELYRLSRTQGFGKEVKRRIMLGTFVLSAGYYDAYYTKAQKVRRLIKDAIDNLLFNYDAILMPTSTDVAFSLGCYQDDPVGMYLSDVFTVIANLTGHPAISIPLGRTEEGLSFGTQLIGKSFNEKKLFELSSLIPFLA